MHPPLVCKKQTRLRTAQTPAAGGQELGTLKGDCGGEELRVASSLSYNSHTSIVTVKPVGLTQQSSIDESRPFAAAKVIYAARGEGRDFKIKYVSA